MDEINFAKTLIPALKMLYKAGVIDVVATLYSKPYIQIDVKMFKELYPDIAPVNGHYRYNMGDVDIVAAEVA